MANKDVEIEIKIKVEAGLEMIKEALRKNTTFVKTAEQKDEYFTPIHRNFLQAKFPFEWLSIRKRGGKAILNYKHWHPPNAEIHTHCDEFETVVEKPEQLEKIFSALNIKPLVTVEKTREVYKTEEFEIALDTVKDLGTYIEIEAIKDLGTVEETREKLFEFAKKLGLDLSKTDKKGYPMALLEKAKNI